MKSPKIEQVGKDFTALGFADTYHRWILHIFQNVLGRQIVEVGAGTGSFSRLLEAPPEALTVVEPRGMFDSMVANIPEDAGSTAVTVVNTIFTEAAGDPRSNGRPETIMYTEVLEHFENDASELRAVCETLPAGGRLCMFVPALEVLFSKFDRQIGHFRPYSMKRVTHVCEAAGFKMVVAETPGDD